MDLYTMFGYDEQYDPVVAQHVTAPEARQKATESGLSGYYLAPHWSEFPNNGGMRAYLWNEDKGDYEGCTVRAWVFTHLLDPEKGGTALDDNA